MVCGREKSVSYRDAKRGQFNGLKVQPENSVSFANRLHVLLSHGSILTTSLVSEVICILNPPAILRCNNVFVVRIEYQFLKYIDRN